MRKKESNKITIIDIARQANVSISTVSRVINNPEKVSEIKRQRVRQVIKEVGFVPSILASAFSSKHSRNVVLFLGNEYRYSQYNHFLVLLTMILNNYKFTLILHNFTSSSFLNRKATEMIIAKQPCLIFSFTKKILHFIKKSSHPHISFCFLKAKDLTNQDQLAIKIRRAIKSH